MEKNKEQRPDKAVKLWVTSDNGVVEESVFLYTLNRAKAEKKRPVR
jgi:hypothetical protein